MTITQSFTQGLTRVNRTKRLVVFAWLVNVAFALILALPMLSQLDGYIRGTIKEEPLLEKMDQNWFQTYQLEFQNSEIAKLLDYSIYGYAPFLNHFEGFISGAVVKRVGGFFLDLLSLHFRPSHFDILTLLTFFYVIVNSFLAGGFISTYTSDYRPLLAEFLIDGAKYFGRFLRLAFLSLILYYFFFAVVVDFINHGIPAWTQNAPSEMTPYVYYMIRNVAVLLVLGLLMMCFDYAKIRMVVEDRYSALGAFGAGFKFVFKNFLKTFGLYLRLCTIGLVLIVLYALIESFFPQRGYWTILLVFILQQSYMLFRIWLKASFYATQTTLYQGLLPEQYKATLSSVSSAGA